MLYTSKNAFLALVGVSLGASFFISSALPVYPQTADFSRKEIASAVTPNLVEQVSDHYLKRYKQWKAAFLSAPIGRQLWLKYAASPIFHLTIIVSKNQENGAKVEDYRWESGKLAAATMILGSQLNYGYPGQQYYPVLGSLAFTRYPWEERSDSILAAAKIAHEFGHIDHTANSEAGDYQLRNELLDIYASQFKSNGYDANDPVLKNLADRMGGIPDQIHGQREFWAETYSLRYLEDKLGSWERRQLVRLVRKSLLSSGAYSIPSQSEWTDLTSSDRRPVPGGRLEIISANE